jgi:hypothetical protein
MGLLLGEQFFVGHERIVNRDARLTAAGIRNHDLHGSFLASHIDPSLCVDLLHSEVHRFEAIAAEGGVQGGRHPHDNGIGTEPILGLHEQRTPGKQKHQSHH